MNALFRPPFPTGSRRPRSGPSCLHRYCRAPLRFKGSSLPATRLRRSETAPGLGKRGHSRAVEGEPGVGLKDVARSGRALQGALVQYQQRQKGCPAGSA
jgi:hypothetical protein